MPRSGTSRCLPTACQVFTGGMRDYRIYDLQMRFLGFLKRSIRKRQTSRGSTRRTP